MELQTTVSDERIRGAGVLQGGMVLRSTRLGRS